MAVICHFSEISYLNHLPLSTPDNLISMLILCEKSNAPDESASCGIQHVSGALLPAVDWPAFKNYKWILIRACGEKKNTIMVINLQESYHELKTLYKCFLDYLSLGITYAMISSMTVDN